MTLSFIVAIGEDNAMGVHNKLPWHLPKDLKFFKSTTLGKPVLMGRKTLDSLGKPLPNRLNIVLSRQTDLPVPDGVLLFHTIDEAIQHLSDQEEVFIIGGGKIFEETMHVADRMYITRVHGEFPEADTFFPHIDHSQWKLEWEEAHPADEKHAYAFTFQRYERIAL